MPNPVTTSELAVRFRPLVGAEEEYAQALLDDAWEILLVHKPNLDAQMAAEEVSQGAVSVVISSMVLRVLRNPDGVRQWSVDDYSETRDNSVAAGALYVSPDELGLLAPAGTGSGAAFTITPGNDGPGYSTALPPSLLGWS